MKQKGHVLLRVLFAITIIFVNLQSTALFGHGNKNDSHVHHFSFQNENNESVECHCSFCNELGARHDFDPSLLVKRSKTAWTFAVYMAADNDLRSFAARNIQQMANIGSNANINIVVHLDIHITPTQKVTRRYLVKSANEIYHMNANDPTTQIMDSGDEKTLISFGTWAATAFPAEHYALILWNHGTGIIDPERHKIINPTSLFVFNPETNTLELDRSISYLDLIEPQLRGICWDDTTRNFLTNQKLEFALATLTEDVLGKKFDIIGFDACLMAMLEVGSIVKKYASIMVGSQDVELGAGWNYETALEPFQNSIPTPQELATNIVYTYKEAYDQITQDYTLSATNLENLALLENAINNVAKNLLFCISQQNKSNTKTAIKTAVKNATCFEERTYKDVADLLIGIKQASKEFSFKNQRIGATTIQDLHKLIATALELLEECVFANVSGRNLPRATGLAIYFPHNRIHASYPKNSFAAGSQWLKLISQCLG